MHRRSNQQWVEDLALNDSKGWSAGKVPSTEVSVESTSTKWGRLLWKAPPKEGPTERELTLAPRRPAHPRSGIATAAGPEVLQISASPRARVKAGDKLPRSSRRGVARVGPRAGTKRHRPPLPFITESTVSPSSGEALRDHKRT